jgi:hypothetical protein
LLQLAGSDLMGNVLGNLGWGYFRSACLVSRGVWLRIVDCSLKFININCASLRDFTPAGVQRSRLPLTIVTFAHEHVNVRRLLSLIRVLFFLVLIQDIFVLLELELVIIGLLRFLASALFVVLQ